MGESKELLTEMELEDSTDPSQKKIKGNIAELTQPARDVKGKIHTQNWKPQGWKQKNKPQAAKYHNWLTPLCWTQILRSMGFEPLELGLRQFRPCEGAHQRALLLP